MADTTDRAEANGPVIDEGYPKVLAHPALPDEQTITVRRASQERIHRAAGWVAQDELKKSGARKAAAEKKES